MVGVTEREGAGHQARTRWEVRQAIVRVAGDARSFGGGA